MNTSACARAVFYTKSSKGIEFLHYILEVFTSSQVSVYSKKIESTKRTIISSTVFKETFDSLQESVQRNKILSVFELFIAENVEELFRKLRWEGESQKIEF